MPYTTFMSVDLPAPFSPSSAWTRPHSTARSTPSTALKPPKVLTTLRSSRAVDCLGLDAGAEGAVLQARLDLAYLGLDVSRNFRVPIVVVREPDPVVADIEGLHTCFEGAMDDVRDCRLHSDIQVLLGARDQA